MSGEKNMRRSEQKAKMSGEEYMRRTEHGVTSIEQCCKQDAIICDRFPEPFVPMSRPIHISVSTVHMPSKQNVPKLRRPPVKYKKRRAENHTLSMLPQ